MFARVIRPDGSILNLARDDRAQTASGTEATFRFSDATPGTILEYEYTVDMPRYASVISEYANAEIPTEHYRLEMELKEIIYEIKAYNDGTPFETGGNEEVRRIFWSHDFLPPITDEEYAPIRSLRDPWWRLRVLQCAFPGSAFDQTRTWDSAMSGAAGRLYFDQSFYEGMEAQPVVDRSLDAKGRLEAALGALRRSVSFEGFASKRRSRPVKEVIASGRADALEEARFFWLLLKRYGIEAELAYTARPLIDHFDKDAPIPELPHLIVWVPAQAGIDAPLWIDPSCEYCKLGEVPEWDRGTEALIVHGEETGLSHRTEVTTEWRQIEGKDPVPAEHRTRYRAKILPGGDLEMHVEARGLGDEAQALHIEHVVKGEEDWRAFAERWARIADPRATVTRFEPYTFSKAHDEAWTAFDFTVPGFARIENERLTVPLSMLTKRWDATFSREERKLDIDWWESTTREESVTIEPPSGWVLDRAPSAEEIETPLLTVAVKARAESGGAAVTRSISIHRGHYAKDIYPAVKRALDLLRATREEAVSFKRVESRVH
jgi:hypothetical protein